MEREKTAAFSGHRPNKLPWGYDENDPRCISLKENIAASLEGLISQGYEDFLCGMAQGCDLYFAEAVLTLRKRHPGIRLHAVVPCRTQAEHWPEALQRRYEHILAESDEVNFLQPAYTPGCMQRRNQVLVENASFLLACYDGSAGGTRSTILLARHSGRRVMVIDIE